MRSVMNHVFSQVPKAEVPRSQFDRSHGLKTTFDAGYLVPIYVDEALPGDTFKMSANILARLSTPITPIMDNLVLDTFFFSVPIRLIWTNFYKFMGAQDNPGDSVSYTIPTMTAPVAGAPGGHLVGSLSDYLGIPTQIGSLVHSSLWHRAYNLIWNEWFRDENLQNAVTVDKGDGPDTTTNYSLLKRGKRHDYFTSCLPWAQKGTSVTLPLGTSAPVIISGTNTFGLVRKASDGTLSGGANQLGTDTNSHFELTTGVDEFYDPNGTLKADLSSATAATINQIRQAFQTQKLLERDARGGTRYTEIVRSHFGVVSPDARLQRPEYLGGGSSFVNIHPIAKTSSTDGTSAQGNLAAIGTVTANGHGFVKSFTEHCVLIGMVCVRADLTYQQGLDRMFSRSTRYDYYWPALAMIGEQAVLNKEIYAQNDGNDSLVFGYQERYAEYRYKPSKITGKFRSTYATPLDMWHLSQKFTSLPTLNSTFIQETPPMSRVKAVTTEPDFILDSYFNLICARPMPVYSVPGLMDHF